MDEVGDSENLLFLMPRSCCVNIGGRQMGWRRLLKLALPTLLGGERGGGTERSDKVCTKHPKANFWLRNR